LPNLRVNNRHLHRFNYSLQLKRQYVGLDVSDYLEADYKRVVYIDNFQEIKLNEKYIAKFLENLEGFFDHILIFIDTSIQYSESEYYNFSNYKKYSILNFGHVKRAELASRWNALGREETIPLQDLASLQDSSKKSMDSIILKNIVPSRPIYLISILQALDVSKPNELGLTSYGHCYHLLILRTLERAKIPPKEIDSYINFLTELAFYIYQLGDSSIRTTQTTEFLRLYRQDYVGREPEGLLDDLREAGILIRGSGDSLYFGYKYIWYFYCGKFISENYNNQQLDGVVGELASSIHEETNANILIFLLHHTKDQSIINTIIAQTDSIFSDENVATLETDTLEFLSEYINTLPRIVIEHRSVEREREKRHRYADEAELSKEEDSEIDESSDQDLPKSTQEERDVTSREINRSVRAVEILGQVLRNRTGSLKKVQLESLVLSAYGSGLRFLNRCLSAFSEHHNAVMAVIEKILKDDPDIPAEVATQLASREIFGTAFGICFAVIYKLANALGSTELLPIFEGIAAQDPSPAHRLIAVAIQLENTKKLPKKQLLELMDEFKSNIVSQRILKELVVRHLYLHYLSTEDKQWISATLKLPMDTQRVMERDANQKQVARRGSETVRK
jgi:hypothetical protein